MTGDQVFEESGLKRTPEPVHWLLTLYVAGQTPRSITAFANLKQICEQHLHGHYDIEIIDVVARPELATRDQVVALPTLVRKLPEPVRKVIGDLSNTEKVLVGLEVRTVERQQDETGA